MLKVVAGFTTACWVTAVHALTLARGVSYASVRSSPWFFCADSNLQQMKEVIFICIFFFLQGDKEKHGMILVHDLTIS